MTAMRTDRRKAASLHQANTGSVVGEESAEQLVKVIPLCLGGECFG
jgi:hypothetical protein